MGARGLLVDLDAIEGMVPATQMLVSQVIDLLGVVARAEATYVDSGDGAPGHLFESGRGGAGRED